MLKTDGPTNVSNFEPLVAEEYFIPDFKQTTLFFINVGWIFD